MDNELKQKIALFVIALLLITKFIYVPQIEKQDDLVAKITATKKTNNKYQVLLSQRTKLESFSSTISAVEGKIGEQLSTFNSQADFLLQTQKKIESALLKSNIKVKRFIWFKNKEEASKQGLRKKRIRLVLTGQSKNFLSFHAWLKKQEPQFYTESISLNTGKKTESTMGWFDGTVIISAYYIQGEL
ncbi:MAG: hypothetical protein COB35_11720 [Gammaproteobacteria bacterium]|nr:MAG: hypothetical protein COB35_11720 [Gammaproteobacteria bacterium]